MIKRANSMGPRFEANSLVTTSFKSGELLPEIEISAREMKNDREFKFLLDKIKRNRNIDFSQYRPRVLERRIQHRLHLTGCANYLDYVMLLNKDPEEYDRLIECLSIKVSEFFRDPKVFDLLGDMVIPQIVTEKQARGDKKIRAWSCGAAFGQEAYSMAILFCEVLGISLDGFDIKILATDIDKDALEKAPWGSYDRTSLHKISPHLLFKYFTRIGDRYILSDKARALVSFQYHDIISGNTMPSMDLVLCRNLLIYFQKENQATILKKLHEVLMSSGFLVLGKTETLPPQMSDCFDVVDLRERIYRKRLPIKQERQGRKMAEICATKV
jgi:chemotaxis methyl-accepting protein methylase